MCPNRERLVVLRLSDLPAGRNRSDESLKITTKAELYKRTIILVVENELCILMF